MFSHDTEYGGYGFIDDEPPIFYDADGNVMEFAAGEEPEEIPLPTINAKMLVNTTHPNVKQAIYDDDSCDLIFYVPQGWSVSDIEYEKLQGMILRGVRVWQVDNKICVVNIDVENTHTCKYFTASAELFESAEEEMLPAEDFPFFKPGFFNGCVHPDRMSQSPHMNHECDYASQQNNCSIYKPQEWTTVSITKGSSSAGVEEVVELQSARRGFGVPVLRDVVDGKAQTTTIEAHDQRIGHLVETTNVELEEAPVTKTSFLEFVLT